MRKLLHRINRQHLAIFFCGLLLVAMIYSPFLLSVSMIMLVMIAVFDIQIEPQFTVGLNPNLKKNLGIFLANNAYLAVTLCFFIVLVSGLISEDFSYWLERLRLKLPFLVLPFAFASIQPLSQRQYFGLFYFLLLVIFLTSIGIGINYILHFDEIQVAIGRGQSIPTPRNHIRFSLVLALSILAGINLYMEKFYLKYPWERRLILGVTVFLFLFIHVLSVRSGLLVLYVALFLWCIRYIIQSRRFGLGFSVLTGMAVLPIAAYMFLPSFQMKVHYAIWDIKMYLEGRGESYSDSGRLTSLAVGMKIGNQHPVLGVGAGDLKQEVEKVYAADYSNAPVALMPHNQFVSVYAGMGIVGVLLFTFAFFYPVFYQKNYRDSLFFAFHVIVFLSFMMENTIENSIGIAFYVFFLLLGLNYLSGVQGEYAD